MNKYKNKPQSIDGENYRSKREHRRHIDLKLLERSGQICGLSREVAFVLAPAVKIGGRMRPPLRYIADFVYSVPKSGSVVVEDAKGIRTEGYRIKRHLMKSILGIDILET